jgi:hypothetical protein
VHLKAIEGALQNAFPRRPFVESFSPHIKFARPKAEPPAARVTGSP